MLPVTMPLEAATLKTNVEGLDDLPRVKTQVGKVLKGQGDLPKKADIDDYRHAAEENRQKVIKVLKAEGYYQSIVTVKVDATEPDASITVHAGPIMTISAIRFEGPEYPLKTVKVGQPLLAAPVLAEQTRLFEEISASSCLFGLEVSHLAILDMEKHTAELVFRVTNQGYAKIGKVSFTGLDRVKEDYARDLISLRQGECYRAADIEKAQADLLQTGLFSIVKVQLPDRPDANRVVSVNFDAHERKPRTLKAGVTYYTDEGPGLLGGWEHHNIFGRGEDLAVDAKLSRLETSLTTTFKKPFFLRKDQTLNLDADIKKENTDAYDSRSTGIHGTVERQIGKPLKIGLGGGYDAIRIQTGDDLQTYLLLFGLGFAEWDDRDKPLDAHRGLKARLEVKPYIDLLQPNDIFWKTQANASSYFALAPKTKFDPVIAIRGRLGSILGQGTITLPATERFYAGGGGSVRGFSYQAIGPRDEDGDPSGGRSVIETSAELRVKFTETIGAVAFLDGGNVSEQITPGFSDGYAIGTGVGLRYYTAFGPIRFDVGIPLTQKDEAGGQYHFYISIGQAF